MKKQVTVETNVSADIEKVWDYWTDPKHIINWNFASPDWHCPMAENSLKVGGRFSWRMESKDGEMGFDYCGTYNNVIVNKEISHLLDDGRKVKVTFLKNGNEVTIRETFEVEDESSIEMQRQGWQNILDNFKNYTEST